MLKEMEKGKEMENPLSACTEQKAVWAASMAGWREVMTVADLG